MSETVTNIEKSLEDLVWVFVSGIVHGVGAERHHAQGLAGQIARRYRVADVKTEQEVYLDALIEQVWDLLAVTCFASVDPQPVHAQQVTRRLLDKYRLTERG